MREGELLFFQMLLKVCSCIDFLILKFAGDLPWSVFVCYISGGRGLLNDSFLGVRNEDHGNESTQKDDEKNTFQHFQDPSPPSPPGPNTSILRDI